MLVSPAAELKICSKRRRASVTGLLSGKVSLLPPLPVQAWTKEAATLIGTVALGPPRARRESFREAPQSRHVAGQPCLPLGVQEPPRARSMGRVRVTVCLCSRSTSWRTPGDMRRGRTVKVTLRAGVLPATLSRGPPCSLLQPGTDVGGHMAATAGAGRGCEPVAGEAGCPPRLRNVGRLLWLWIQPGRGLGVRS
ncbi:unnamed protein product [Rangifer tarandus platyrhynchus]|uniref:Uncharacterized protein n=2 Tax=Rangifer tarandus platyrhynchus TaxID=3082113 RepID=A0ABN8ZEP9_RANTA|nr:unnamed protein product [Rangifer tarandus platyrhynchus]CAI9706004.1 unnamed protein product [Rangifer tarandus platyrhynchus]